jgi:hypothetical protein
VQLERLRPGELVAGLASIALLVLLFLHWVQAEPTVIRDPGAEIPAPLQSAADQTVDGFVSRTAESGWSGLGVVVVALLVLLALGGIATFALTVSRATVATPIAAEVITSALGMITTTVLLVRLGVAQPDLGLGLQDADVDVRTPALLGLACTFLITAGAWYGLGDERTTAPYSAPPDLPARPAPAAGRSAAAGEL